MSEDGDTLGERGPQTKTTTYPLNSKRLTSRSVLRIARGLGLPTSASLADTRQMIEGRLVEKGRQPQNVEVHVIESEVGLTIRLNDEEGVILEVPPEEESASRGATPSEGETIELEEIGDREGRLGGAATSGARGSGVEPSRAREAEEELEDLRTELEAVRSQSTRLEAELERVQGLAAEESSRLQAEVSQLSERVKREKEKYSALWRMNCDRLLEHDNSMLAKEHEIDTLKARIVELETVSITRMPERHPDTGHSGVSHRTEPRGVASPSARHTATPIVEAEPHHASEHGFTSHRESDSAVTSSPRRLSHDGPVREVHAVMSYSGGWIRESVRGGPAPVRRGKAPPIDPFTGESPDVLFEDWYPALQRAAEWNNWSQGETLIQLAGYLHGRALQEWTLLSTHDKATLDLAVTNLHSRSDPCSRALASQDFRHASQRENEPVADFIIRLEQMFKLAFGREKLSDETRKM